MLDITLQLDISTMLILQVTTIICYKKNIIKKKKKERKYNKTMWRLDKTHMLTKTVHM